MRRVYVDVWNDIGVELDYRLFATALFGSQFMVTYVSPINSRYVLLRAEYRNPVCFCAYSFYEDDLVWGCECVEEPASIDSVSITTDVAVSLCNRWSNDIRVSTVRRSDDPPSYDIVVDTSDRGMVLRFFVNDERLLQDLFAYILYLKGCSCVKRVYCIRGTPYCSDLDLVCSCNSTGLWSRRMLIELKSINAFGMHRVTRNQVRKVVARILFFYMLKDLFGGDIDIYLAIPFVFPQDLDPGIPYIAMIGTDLVVNDRGTDIDKRDIRYLGATG